IPWPGREKRGGNTVYVHRGIWMAYQAAANSLYEIVRDLLKKKYRKKPRILVTGHSLGGALAQFAGNDLGAWFPNVKTEVYTFAAPRVGDADFEAVLCSNADGVYQVINEHDPVPYVPPVGPNWARKDKKYKTAGATKYLRGNGKITKAPKAALAIWPFNHQIKAYRKALEKAVERRAGADNAVTAAVTDAKDLAETAAGQVSKAVDNTARDAAKTAKKATKSVDRAAKKASRDAKRTLNKVLKGPKKLFGG
ncbi:MAG: lipase family protein, partial [Pseudomonadota bacterium]